MPLEIPSYRIVNTLGRGGMATVYLAIQDVFERQVALKVMSRALADDPNFSQRFFREAKIVSQLVHPNIVTVYDVGVHDGYCYLSMEYIDGHDLKQVVDQLNLRQKIAAIRDIAKALDYAGAKGYVHRDIKPENIMFHSSDGRAVLMDFGIARAVESEISVTQTGIAIGTPHYMSPEQAKGKPVDFRSDIYSLGVVLYFVLCGEVPYDADSAIAIGIKHITHPIPRLPDEYAGLQPILDRMMAKSAGDRYQSAKALIADIDQLDIEVLEHQLEFARASARHVADPVRMQSHPTLNRSDSVPDVELDSPARSRAFDNYELEREAFAKERAPVLPWFLSGTFVVTVIAVFFYFKNPEWFRPWMDKGFAAFDSVKGWARADSDVDRRVSAPEPRPEQHGDTTAQVIPPSAQLQSPAGEVQPETARLAVENQGMLEKLQEKIRQLEKSYARDTLYLNDLVAAYRELMAHSPEAKGLQSKIDQLKNSAFDALQDQARKEGSSDNFNAKLEQLRMLFPEEKKSRFDSLLALAENRKYVMSHLVEGEAYLRQNNLTQPKGRNAVDSFRKALERDPKNTAALAGLSKVSSRLASQAQTRLKAGELTPAKDLAQKALEIDTSNQSAKQVIAALEEKRAEAGRISSLLAAAKSKLDQGQLFTPENQGAFHDYQAVLKLDANNAAATEGVKKVLDALSAQVWQLVGNEQFDQAESVVAAAKKALGENQQINSLAAAVENVMENKRAEQAR